MLNVMIKAKGKESLIIELPKDIYMLYEQLYLNGIRKPLEKINLSDDEEDEIRVKLYSGNEVGNQLIGMMSEKNTLQDINAAAYVIKHVHAKIRDSLNSKISNHEYKTPEDLYASIGDLTKEKSEEIKIFYFPLKGELELDECEDEEDPEELYSVSGRYFAGYEEEIRVALLEDQNRGNKNMAEYFNEDENIKEKLYSVMWDVEEKKETLLGKVTLYLAEPLTEEETEIMREWITGQNSDGLGEGLEQHPIKVGEGNLYVSMWSYSDDYFVKTRDEMKENLGASYGAISL